MYQHLCVGEPKSGDEPKPTGESTVVREPTVFRDPTVAGESTVVRESTVVKESTVVRESTETKKPNYSDDKELAPPPKYVKLSLNQPGVVTLVQNAVQTESLGDAVNSFRQNDITLKDREQTACRGCKKKTKKETLQPESDAKQPMLGAKVEIGFSGVELKELNGVTTRLVPQRHVATNPFYMHMQRVGFTDRRFAYDPFLMDREEQQLFDNLEQDMLNIGSRGLIGHIKPRRQMDLLEPYYGVV